MDCLRCRPGYALQWALIEDVFNGGERSEVMAEVAETFGAELASRLEAADPTCAPDSLPALSSLSVPGRRRL